jgi:hypothetical protein
MRRVAISNATPGTSGYFHRAWCASRVVWRFACTDAGSRPTRDSRLRPQMFPSSRTPARPMSERSERLDGSKLLSSAKHGSLLVDKHSGVVSRRFKRALFDPQLLLILRLRGLFVVAVLRFSPQLRTLISACRAVTCTAARDQRRYSHHSAMLRAVGQMLCTDVFR